MSVTPVFIFSLPRSGSTLMQRILASHRGVATAAEPWVLLPLLDPLTATPLQSPWQRTVSGAVEDFLGQVPDGRAEYERAIRSLALSLYSRAAGAEARFFVDKTPPYHLIAEDVIRLFPDARFVFLWRNPLSVVASIVETFCGGRWDVYRYRGDLFHGVENLVRASRRHADAAHAVRYEDLVADATAWERLLAYIGLDFDPEALNGFTAVRLEGRMGDPTGAGRYPTMSTESLDKWRTTIASPARRAWTRRYLRWVGPERLAVMGYDLDTLLGELEAGPSTAEGLVDDVWQLVASSAREIVKARVPGDPMVSSWRLLLGAGGGAPGARG